MELDSFPNPCSCYYCLNAMGLVTKIYVNLQEWCKKFTQNLIRSQKSNDKKNLIVAFFVTI